MDDDTLDNKDMLETTEAFEDAYRAHSGAIYKFLFWRTKNEQISEDLTSTTFQKAWMARKSFHGGSAQAWFYRIARNTLFDYWRKDREIPSDQLAEVVESDAQSNAEALDKKMEVERLQRALTKLPTDMREVVRLRFIEGKSSKEAAQILGISDGNIRIIQYRALKKLRELLR